MTDKRDAILQATLKLVSRHGFHGTSMARVAQEAGVSAGIIYHYFAGKDQVMDEVYHDIKRRFGAALAEEFDAGQPLARQVHQALEIMMRYYIQRPLESAFIEQYTRSPYHTREIDEATRQYYAPLLTSFQRAQEEGIIKDLPPAVIQAFTLDVATSLAQRQVAGFLELTDELIEEIVEAAWEAIRR